MFGGHKHKLSVVADAQQFGSAVFEPVAHGVCDDRVVVAVLRVAARRVQSERSYHVGFVYSDRLVCAPLVIVVLECERVCEQVESQVALVLFNRVTKFRNGHHVE